MFPQFETQIRTQAVETYPKEGVWLITAKGCRQVENIHEAPEKFFRVGTRDLARANAEGLLAVVHSHCDQPEVPSASDMVGHQNTAVPWGFLSVGAEGASRIRWWNDKKPAPLLGRTFTHGISDCYALVRDYYRMEHGIDLPIFPRDWGWWNEGLDLLTEGVSTAGFLPIPSEEVREGDVWFAKFGGPVPHHCGVYAGNDLVLHQLGAPSAPIDDTRISAKEPISRYTRFICSWVRYKEW